MRKIWHDEAWEDYIYWQTQDKKTLKKINKINNLDQKNRIVFRINGEEIEVLQCGSHYRDK